MPQVYDTRTGRVNVTHTTGQRFGYGVHVIQDINHKAQIGARLAAARTRAGMTQTEVGQLCEVKKAAVSGWENGKNYPDLGQFTRLLRAYNISAEEVLYGRPVLSPRALELATSLDAIEDDLVKRWAFSVVESTIVNAQDRIRVPEVDSASSRNERQRLR